MSVGGRGAQAATPGVQAAGDFVTMMVADQLFGIPVLAVHDVLGPHRITPIPLAPREIAGVLNLRGRIVTAIDLRTRLGQSARPPEAGIMSIVVDKAGELYSLIVDHVGEVLNLPAAAHERTPATLDPQWQDVSAGIYRLDGRLMVVLDVDRLLDIPRAAAA